MLCKIYVQEYTTAIRAKNKLPLCIHLDDPTFFRYYVHIEAHTPHIRIFWVSEQKILSEVDATHEFGAVAVSYASYKNRGKVQKE